MIDVTDDLKSKTALKNKAKDIHMFGKILVGLSDKQISQIKLPESVHEAIREFKKLKKNSAKNRQSLYLAKLLRAIDISEAQQFVAHLKFESQTEIRKFHKIEDWRNKLIADISNLTDFVNLSPAIDIQKLRKLILNSQKEIKKGSSNKFQKELFQLIKDIL
ncbi:ribosome biogenesis factor YjgA [Methylophilaceae bacterium]|nr:ribosome biogenesis factor YjgA [Methylophilaceae bacterium]